MKTIFFMLLFCVPLWLFAGTSMPTSMVMRDVERYIAREQEQMKTQLATVADPLARARLELQIRVAQKREQAAYRDRLLRSGALTTPEIETLRAQRKASLEQGHPVAPLDVLDQALQAASVEAPEIQAFDQYCAENATAIERLRERLTLMLPAKRKALEAKRASKKSNN